MYICNTVHNVHAVMLWLISVHVYRERWMDIDTQGLYNAVFNKLEN